MTRCGSLEVEYIDGRTWLLLDDFHAYSEVLGRELTVPGGFLTDFNSIPRILWSILPPTEYGEAAVLHDYLYRYNGVEREQADQVHREFVKWKGAPGWKVAAMYRALRWFGGRRWSAYRKQDEARRVGAGGGTATR